MPGWRRGSFYRTFGRYRSSSQAISYEGLFFFSIIILIFFFIDYRFFFSMTFVSYILIIIRFLYFSPTWICAIVAESNRSPFDFAEGESELVSGFNTEYSGGLFSIIFLREYTSIILLSYLTALVFVGNSLVTIFFFSFFLFFYVWIRTAFPRLRYDKLIVFSWKRLIFLITGITIGYLFMIFF